MPLSHALFRVRTRQLLDQRGPVENRAFLSGLLIGAELVGLTSSSEDQPVVLAAGPAMVEAYARALGALGLSNRTVVVPAEDVARLSALGQAVLLRRVGLI
jgi:2-keto-3-deoxy-galactonokinase